MFQLQRISNSFCRMQKDICLLQANLKKSEKIKLLCIGYLIAFWSLHKARWLPFEFLQMLLCCPFDYFAFVIYEFHGMLIVFCNTAGRIKYNKIKIKVNKKANVKNFLNYPRTYTPKPALLNQCVPLSSDLIWCGLPYKNLKKLL